MTWKSSSHFGFGTCQAIGKVSGTYQNPFQREICLRPLQGTFRIEDLDLDLESLLLDLERDLDLRDLDLDLERRERDLRPK